MTLLGMTLLRRGGEGRKEVGMRTWRETKEVREMGGEDTFTRPRCYLLSRGLISKLRILRLKLVVPPATSI